MEHGEQKSTGFDRTIRGSMALNFIGGIILLLLVFYIIVSVLSFVFFTDAFQKEYMVTTYHMAETASLLVNGDHIDEYLEGKETEEYERIHDNLTRYCISMNVSLIYVIKVDTSDYGRFVSVINIVNNAVDNSTYVPWEIGYQRNTTNREYEQKYKKLYENGSAYETVFQAKPTDGAHPHITTMVPVKDAAGEVVSILCVQRPISELNNARRPFIVNMGFVTLLLGFLSAFVTFFFIRRQFVVPIKKVSDEATRFARENTIGKPLGEISQYREIVNLADSIDKMETDMVNYIVNLTLATAERERMGAELSLASTIQENAVPNVFPAFPDRKDFDIYAFMKPAKEVGGDFYNFFLIDDDHLALSIGDVSGKGIPAALFMMVTNIVVSDRTLMGGTPGEILEFVNNTICEHNQAEMFVTIWLGILELSTGHMIAANAGHEDPAICRKDGSFELAKTKHNMPIGAMPGIHFLDNTLELGRGDKLFVYTDGVTEATDKDGKMFGLEGMLATLNEHKDSSPKEILEDVHTGVNTFVGDAAQFDDLTMLCLIRN